MKKEILDFYLEANYPAKTVREIADATGLSRSAIGRRIKALGLSPSDSEKGGTRNGTSGTAQVIVVNRRASASDDGPSSQERLEELMDILHGFLKCADEKSVARIASEYRATIEALGELRDSGADDLPSAITDLMDKYA